MKLKYKGFQQFAPKNFFEFVHIFGSVNSQVDMIDSHFLPLGFASSAFILTSVLFFMRK